MKMNIEMETVTAVVMTSSFAVVVITYLIIRYGKKITFRNKHDIEVGIK